MEVVLIDPDTKRAYGVRFFRYGEYHDVHARKEVILSAGAINTPQLLMLSGIGPKEHLEDLNNDFQAIGKGLLTFYE
ncbi:hypothetical protein Anas_04610 [Armadillidium nasatum]|uniref:Glucose-methanol-choline oxidoreductase N-terminal domain-containing protein n=1 Tax=Armadillidium nasatum TaxID=96803 RepID=A0A5N5SHT6_9CRUS|nr:hypothetical protein Anas_04610 [Armadillidium nasatum]